MKDELSKEDHLAILKELKKYYGDGNMCFPQHEGAFYFGRYITHDEYTELYEAECKKRGWIEQVA